VEGNEALERLARRLEDVLWPHRVAKPERHATAEDLVLGAPEMALHDPVVRDEACLRASVETVAPGGDHDAGDKHAHIEPTADLEPAIEKEEEADGGVEEYKVASILRPHCSYVAAADAQRAMELSRDF
jgi:hypothetical protein